MRLIIKRSVADQAKCESGMVRSKPFVELPPVRRYKQHTFTPLQVDYIAFLHALQLRLPSGSRFVAVIDRAVVTARGYDIAVN